MNFLEGIAANWHVIASIAALVAAVALLFLATKFVRHEKCEEHRKEMEKDQADSIAALPNKEALHSLQLQMVALQGSIEALNKEIQGHEKALENIEKLSRSMNNYLLTHGVKR